MKRLLLLVLALIALATALGCSYTAATWNAKSGKMIITKSAIGGLSRGVYECTPSAESFNCQELPDKP